ncbi:MAG: phosphoribosylglycinamide formyltransferase [Acidobacteriota bacterium]|nr:MAG: phosphoribosylglycinamide formyltransferase [Acidobacteriota bacterium]
MSKASTRIAVLLSGRGSNFLAIARKVLDGTIPGEIVLVLSNRSDAVGLKKAEDLGIDTLYLSHHGKSREDFDREMVAALRERNVELVCLAGFMRILSPIFIRAFPMRVLNIHPALLPAFRGLDGQRQAFEAGVKVAGATVHFVTEGLDEGPIILQKAVPVREDDTVETLSRRILRQEHKIYPEAVRLFCEGRIEVRGHKVHIRQ